MTPKEKAKYLFDGYWTYLRANLMYDEEAREDAIVCSLILINEMIKETGSKYWYDVKKEIENHNYGRK
jgi:hypothetical protein